MIYGSIPFFKSEESKAFVLRSIEALDKIQSKSAIFELYRKTLDKLKKEQRKHSKIHEKIANQRRNFLHKLSTQIANELDIVYIEDFDMKVMSQCLNFGKCS